MALFILFSGQEVTHNLIIPIFKVSPTEAVETFSVLGMLATLNFSSTVFIPCLLHLNKQRNKIRAKNKRTIVLDLLFFNYVINL